MMGELKGTVSELAVKVGELYKELVTNTEDRILLAIPSPGSVAKLLPPRDN
jgi:hypothetical protein